MKYRFAMPMFRRATLPRRGCRCLSSGQVATALRPFYFAVHPDLFGRHPQQRAVNENSLKLLNAYLDSAQNNSYVKPFSLVFYVRKKEEQSSEFTEVRVQVCKDVRSTVTDILNTCELDTAFLESIPYKHITPQKRNSLSSWGPFQGFQVDFDNPFWDAEDVEGKIEFEEEETMGVWLKKNVGEAEDRMRACQPVRDEIVRLRKELCDRLSLKSILWECGWNALHFRGSLQSFNAMAKNHPENMYKLKGRSLLFGPATGVSLAGHVMLYSGEVRHNWLDFIKNVDQWNVYLKSIPALERSLGAILRGVSIRHRRSQNTILASDYASQVRKLLTSLEDHRGKEGFPSDWPDTLRHLQIIVENAGGPLMVLPSGQLLIPSNCIASSLVKFMSRNMNSATKCFHEYQRHRVNEHKLRRLCHSVYGLSVLECDESVTADRMCSFLETLVAHPSLARRLSGTRVMVTSYYAVLPDGAICLPWNFKP